MQDNFIKSLESLQLCVDENSDNIADLINKIFKLTDTVIIKLLDNKKFYVVNKFFYTIEKGIGKFAGAMTYAEFCYLRQLALENLLTIKHCRKACNVFWALCKVFITYIFLDGLGNAVDNIRIDIVKENINNGMINLDRYFHDIDVKLIKKIFVDGINLTEEIFGKEIVVETNTDLFYKHVVKCSYLEGRIKSTKLRGNHGGYSADILNSVYTYIQPLLSDEEMSQQLPDEKYPWTGENIIGITEGYYLDFCLKNNLYFVSGISGSTFELMLYMIALFKPKSEQEYKTIMLFFLHFHVIRGSHSVLETVMSFYEVNNYLTNVPEIERHHLTKLITNIIHMNTLRHSTKLCEELINGVICDIQHVDFYLDV